MAWPLIIPPLAAVPQTHHILPKPLLRGLVARLPDWLIPKKQWGCVVKVSNAGPGGWACSSFAALHDLVRVCQDLQ